MQWRKHRIMTEQNDPKAVQASPTKEFFIYNITKDIDTIDAIIELADNCIDGARDLRGENSLKGLFIRIKVDENYFEITDNCGGIPIDVARYRAFMFGRNKDSKAIPHSIGNFGVGMKRSLFKLGRVFQIESTAKNSQFSMHVDVQKWMGEEKWTFEFDDGFKEDMPLVEESQRGTRILVEQLNKGISSDFKKDAFKRRLELGLKSKHQTYLEKGIEISINGVILSSTSPKIRLSNKITPAYKQLRLEDDQLTVKIYAGLGDRDKDKAGWNVFCNGRLILEADQSSVTGWTKEFGNPKFNNEFAWFRGFVFFESDQTDLLPWNTTKTSVDLDSVNYKYIQGQMGEVMRPILNFMYKIAEEKKNSDDSDEDTPLEKIIKETNLVSLDSITEEQEFSAPLDIPPPVNNVRISYSKPKEEVDKLKRALGGINRNSELGKLTFEYVFRRECEDE